MMKVLTVGVFDFFHYGHLKLFQHARELGDWLVVAVQRTEEIHKTKPDAQIFYSFEQRIELVSQLRCVDEVIPYSQIDTDISLIDFDLFAIGEDQKHPGFQRAVEWCLENGKEVVRMKRTKGISSSSIKEQLQEKSKDHDPT